MKTINLLWAVSLICIGVSAVVMTVGDNAGLPDWTTRLCGVICLVALPVLVYTSVRRQRRKRH